VRVLHRLDKGNDAERDDEEDCEDDEGDQLRELKVFKIEALTVSLMLPL
jgi:hypothetical protein